MYNSQTHLDPGAKDSLALHRQEQETRKLTLLREQKQRDLKQLETQLFYKKQEVTRLKTLFDRIKRESVTRQLNAQHEKRDVIGEERQIKDTESRLKTLDQNIVREMSEIGDKISKEKTLIMEHERELQKLEKQKKDIENKTSREKKSFVESLSRLNFFKKKEERESDIAQDLFKKNQSQLKSTEQSLKVFGQEVTVLENKIRALRSGIR